MRKSLLLRYIDGDISQHERDEVLAWIEKDSANRDYFLNLKNMQVRQSLNDTPATKDELQRFMEKVAARKKIRRYRGVSIITAAAAIVAFAFLILKPGESKDALSRQKNELLRVSMSEIPEGYKHIIYTEKGVKSFVVLPDSSKVWLNSASTLEFPDKFLGDTREVFLKGEAYFEVRPDSLVPMIVNTAKDVRVRVLGTKFNMKCYDEDETVETTLYSGKIVLDYTNKGGTEKTMLVAPNTRAVVEDNIAKVENPLSIKDDSAWKDGYLIFNSLPLSEVIKTLERWHGVDFQVDDQKILSYKISATFKSESIVQIMEMLKFCSLIDYKINDKKVEIFAR